MQSTATRPIIVTENDFADKVLKADRPVLVDFWAEWCAPCRALGPVMETLAEDFADKLTVAKVNVDAAQGVAMQYGIRSIPTVILFDKGQIVESFIGVRPRADYEASIQSALS